MKKMMADNKKPGKDIMMEGKVKDKLALKRNDGKENLGKMAKMAKKKK
jgi:hypothetical protein